MNRPDDHIDCIPIDRPGAALRAAGSVQSLGEVDWAGHRRQPTRAHALAMFHTLPDVALAESEGRLTSRMRKTLRSSYKQLEDSNDMARLRDKLSARAA